LWELCDQGVMLTTHLHLVSRLRTSGAILLLLLYAFMVWTMPTFPWLYVLT
jgi:hypothetical protein